MKKTFSASLVLGFGILFLSSPANAYKEQDDPAPLTYAHQISLRQKLQQAIELRYKSLMDRYERGNEEKNILNQEAVHQESKMNAHVNESPTEMKRTGELESPEYNLRRHTTGGNYERPNAKQTFRARAVDYYVDGGDAGVTAMQSGLIKSSEYKVELRPNYWLRNAFIGNIVSPIREVQKRLDVSTGNGVERPSTSYTGNSYRNFMHPFDGRDWMKYEAGAGFYSTEAEVQGEGTVENYDEE